MKILFDTDIGTNIDDALALAYLLKNRDCELIGITTVTGRGGRRAAFARAMCESAGKKVPVYPGSELPLVIRQKQNEAPLLGNVGTGEISREGVMEKGPWHALQFLRSTIRSHPGEIYLLTTGPLTNIALLFLLDPEIPFLLGGMMSMAGVYFPEGRRIRSRETNILLDPHAADRVFSMAPESARLVGLDVTLVCGKSAEEMKSLLERFPFPAVASQVKQWLIGRETVYFHDPLAAVLMFEPGLCTWKRGTVVIEAGTGRCTLLSKRNNNKETVSHLVARTVDVQGFFKAYIEKILI